MSSSSTTTATENHKHCDESNMNVAEADSAVLRGKKRKLVDLVNEDQQQQQTTESVNSDASIRIEQITFESEPEASRPRFEVTNNTTTILCSTNLTSISTSSTSTCETNQQSSTTSNDDLTTSGPVAPSTQSSSSSSAQSLSSESMSEEEDEDDDDDDSDEDEDEEDSDDEDEDDEDDDEYDDAKVDLYTATDSVVSESPFTSTGASASSRINVLSNETAGYNDLRASPSSSPSSSSLSSQNDPICSSSESNNESSDYLGTGLLAATSNAYTSMNVNGNRNNGPMSNGYQYCAYNNSGNNQKYSQHSPPSNQSYSCRNNSRSNNAHSDMLRLRQQIFNLSMTKLNRFRQSTDPSLHRSVMICNTIRMLEKQLERDGCKVNVSPAGVSFISPVPPAPDLDFLPMIQQSPSSLPNNPDASSCMPPMSNNNESAFTSTSSSSSSSPSSSSTSSSSSSVEHSLYPYQTNLCEPASMDNCADYDKYFSIESQNSSGRATPFIKSSFNSNGDYSTSPAAVTTTTNSTNPNSNSAFWANGSDVDQTMSSSEQPDQDRLTNITTWNPMLPYDSPSQSSPNTASSENDSNATIVNQQQSSVSSSSTPECDGQSSAIISFTSPTTTVQSSMVFTTSNGTYQSSASASPPSTFATLLPPASTLTSSSSQSQSALVMSPATTNPESESSYSSSSNSNTTSSNNSTNMPISNGSSSLSVSNGQFNSSCFNSPYLSYNNTNGLVSNETSELPFGDIDLSLYDFDLLTPLSPPNVAPNKAPIISAEELIRNINECSNNATTTLMLNGHYPTSAASINGFSGQITYNTSSSSSSVAMMNSSNAMTTTSISCSNTNSDVLSMVPSTQINVTNSTPPSSSTTTTTTTPTCGSTAAVTNGHLHHHHLIHGSSGRFYKTSAEEHRDQQAIATTIKCHN